MTPGYLAPELIGDEPIMSDCVDQRSGTTLNHVSLSTVVLNTVQLDLNFKKLACAVAHALHEQQKICCELASARELDDVSAARERVKLLFASLNKLVT